MKYIPLLIIMIAIGAYLVGCEVSHCFLDDFDIM